ncbi:MAG TPA: hypothetical protein VKP58_02865 [Candidatus Acidoferrum sp.]|nr:hypothetical protein [Candidatus Acidoferrum sp.]
MASSEFMVMGAMARKTYGDPRKLQRRYLMEGEVQVLSIWRGNLATEERREMEVDCESFRLFVEAQGYGVAVKS